jgi:hypothetical protein
MASKITRVELDCYDIPIHCLFCGQRVIAVPDSAPTGQEPLENPITPCKHTLFVATDEGFEYRSSRFNKAMKLSASTKDPRPDLGEENYDSFTDKVAIANAIKLAIYVPAPSGLGAYIGFAPSLEG